MRKLLIIIAIPLVFTAACATTQTAQSPKQKDESATNEQPQTTQWMTVNDSKKGSLKGFETVNYRMPGKAGEILAFHLKSENPQLYVNLYAPGDAPGQSEAMSAGVTMGQDGFVQLPLNGNYTFQVFQMHANADRNTDTSFELTTELYPNAKDPFALFVKVNSPTPVPFYETIDAVEPKILVEGILMKGACEKGQDKQGGGETEFCSVKTASGQSGFVKSNFLQNINLTKVNASPVAPTGPAQPAAGDSAPSAPALPADSAQPAAGGSAPSAPALPADSAQPAAGDSAPSAPALPADSAPSASDTPAK